MQRFQQQCQPCGIPRLDGIKNGRHAVCVHLIVVHYRQIFGHPQPSVRYP